MKFLKSLFFINILMLIFCSAAWAKGYIYKFRESQVMPMSLSMESEHLSGSYYLSEDEEELRRLVEAGIVESYGPDVLVELMDVANDSEFENQRGYEFAVTNALGVVNNGEYDGRGVRVGIIDTGIISGHGDINYDNIVATRNVTLDATDPNASDVTDYQGHGTSVAGVIAAVTNNRKGLASLASGVELVIVKAFAGSSATTYVSDLLKGMDYALSQGCNVINMSVGAKKDANSAAALGAMEELINEAASKGVIVVAAAGNHDSSPTNRNDLTKDSPFMYPAAFANVISVSSVDSNSNISNFSYHNAMVDVAACGGAIRVLHKSGGTATNSGTSFSSPFVAAVAALVKQIDPNYGVTAFRNLISSTARDAGAAGWDTFYGYGIINVGKMMDALLGRNITVTEGYDGENLTAYSQITNRGFDSYQIRNTWKITYNNGEGERSQLESKLMTLEPRGSITVDCMSIRDITHMVWMADSLEPLCPAKKYEAVGP